MLSSVVVATLCACVSATFYKGSFEPQSGYQRFVGYGPMNSNFGMMGYGNQYDMFNDGYLNGGVGGFQSRGLMGGYQKGGLGGYFKGGMGGQFNGGNIGYYKGGMGRQINDGNGRYLKGMMDSGFEGWNNHGDGFGMGNQDFGFGNMGGAYGIKGFKTGSY